MKLRAIFALLAACAGTAVLTTVAVRHHYGVGEEKDPYTSVAAFRSTVLGEERELVVHLPESYERDAARRYPVLYVLDGASQSAHTASSARVLARIGVMPEVLVVGLPSGEHRARDYTPPFMSAGDNPSGPRGQADRFLRFFETELIPHVDRSYRTEPAARMLAGNSRGGLFVVYSLIERPGLFRASFAYSPALWRDDQRIVPELTRLRGAQPAFLYLSLGDGENEKMTAAFRKATAAMPAGLRWRADITKNATHQTNAELSTPVGLHAYFRDNDPVVDPNASRR